VGVRSRAIRDALNLERQRYILSVQFRKLRKGCLDLSPTRVFRLRRSDDRPATDGCEALAHSVKELLRRR